MKLTILLLLSVYFVPNLSAQIVDTVLISNQIENIKTQEDAKEFLTEVWEKDQSFRGTQTNDSFDIVNLFIT